MRHYVTACRDWQLGPLGTSMLRHCQPFKLHVLAWDWDPTENAWALWGAHPETAIQYVTRAEFLAANRGYAALPGNPRGPTDTVCTSRWRFALDVMERAAVPVTLIDGDLWFWSSPEPAFRQLDDGAKLVVSRHGFASKAEGLPGITWESHRKYGLYNGGFVQFGDPEPLRIMADLTREWCYSVVDRGADGEPMFGDQGHLERVAAGMGWRPRAGDVRVMDVPVNVGPWNVHRWWPERDREPLIAYHYSSLRFDGARVTQLADAPYEITHDQVRLLYDPYVLEVERLARAGR